ncbi:MAG: beta-lactamase family protein [Betaproteobacteria bacterium]|nr:beta-lactamase family protein [Betaproteobacteria bacterium]
MKASLSRLLAASLIAASAFSAHGQSADPHQVQGIVDAAAMPVMQKYAIPGMAVGVTLKGQRYLFDYGVASLETRKPVTRETLFELGSVSKTFTATPSRRGLGFARALP